MLMTKLAFTLAGGIALGLVVNWPSAFFSIAVVATAITFTQLRREIDELRTGAE